MAVGCQPVNLVPRDLQDLYDVQNLVAPALDSLVAALDSGAPVDTANTPFNAEGLPASFGGLPNFGDLPNFGGLPVESDAEALPVDPLS